MSAFQKAQDLGLTTAIVPNSDPQRGYSDAEIVAVLHTLTQGPIPVGDVIQYFDDQNLAELDPIDNAWVGSLIDVIRNQSTPAPIVAGLRSLFVHLAKRTSQTVDTTKPLIAKQTYDLLTALVQMQVVTVEQRDAFYLLDGGRPFKDLTVEQYTAQRVAAEELATKQAMIDAAINPIVNRANAIATWAIHPDTLAKSETDLAAFLADITTSPDGNPTGGE